VSTLFISYSSKDRHFVERLAEDLHTHGVKVWLDKWEINVGDSIIEKIEDGIAENDFLAVVLSLNSTQSNWVRKELSAGLIKELNSRSVVVLPILLEKCNMPLLLSDKKYADFRYDYHAGLNDLIKVLTKDHSTFGIVKEGKREVMSDERQMSWKILFDPFSSSVAKDAAFNVLINLKAVKEMKGIVDDIWMPKEKKLKALKVISENPENYEDFLFSIIIGPYSSDEARDIALTGLINAKSLSNLLQVVNGLFVSDRIRSKASDAIKQISK